jgi:hypothetical protein
MEHDGEFQGIIPSPEMVRARDSGMSMEDFMGPSVMKLLEVQGRTIQQQIEKIPAEGGSVEKNENGNTVIRFGENHSVMKNQVIIADKHGNQILGQEKPEKKESIVNMNGNMFKYKNKKVSPFDIEKELIENIPIAFENPYDAKQWPNAFFGKNQLADWFLTLRDLQKERKTLLEKVGRIIENDCRFEHEKAYFRKMIDDYLKKFIEKTEGELNVSKWIGSLGPCWNIGQCCKQENFSGICTTLKNAKAELNWIKNEFDPVAIMADIKK